MLSYQHIYHAGCLADVHKHSILSVLLEQLVLKGKPLTYIETHSGRGLYDLQSPEALKTGEAKLGIEAVLESEVFPESHPYSKVIKSIRTRYGKDMYPGSPALAKYFLSPQDEIHLMELHPQEIVHLRRNVFGSNVHVHHRDGYEGALALSPPTPRRGIVLIDPSYEVKKEYQDVVAFVQKLHQKWPEGTIGVWYPMLKSNYYETMRDELLALKLKNTVINEIQFSDPATSKGLYGSGMIFIKCPFEVDKKMEECKRIMGPFARS